MTAPELTDAEIASLSPQTRIRELEHQIAVLRRLLSRACARIARLELR